MLKLKQLLFLALALGLASSDIKSMQQAAPPVGSNSASGCSPAPAEAQAKAQAKAKVKQKRSRMGLLALIGGLQAVAGSGAAVAGLVKLLKASKAEAKFYSDYDLQGNYIKGLRRPITDPAEKTAAQAAVKQKALEILLHGAVTAVPGVVTAVGVARGAALQKSQPAYVSFVINVVLAVVGAAGIVVSGSIQGAKKRDLLNVVQAKGKLYSGFDVAGKKLPRGQRRLIADPAEYKALMEQKRRSLVHVMMATRIFGTVIGTSALQAIVSILDAFCGKEIEKTLQPFFHWIM